ncbi:MAG TPA: hypothetical protein VMT10_08755 [Solirubrobacteraceae bacterium]|nr:hypothetical protein [Solirubrobacteraceae bacterium]HVP02645.1 hypothetical protein [Solirubrobacteraceae bacterium]
MGDAATAGLSDRTTESTVAHERAEQRARSRARRADQRRDLYATILDLVDELPAGEPPPQTLSWVVATIDADVRDGVAELIDLLHGEVDRTMSLLRPGVPPEELTPHAQLLALDLQAQSRVADALAACARLRDAFRDRGWL